MLNLKGQVFVLQNYKLELFHDFDEEFNNESEFYVNEFPNILIHSDNKIIVKNFLTHQTIDSVDIGKIMTLRGAYLDKNNLFYAKKHNLNGEFLLDIYKRNINSYTNELIYTTKAEKFNLFKFLKLNNSIVAVSIIDNQYVVFNCEGNRTKEIYRADTETKIFDVRSVYLENNNLLVFHNNGTKQFEIKQDTVIAANLFNYKNISFKLLDKNKNYWTILNNRQVIVSNTTVGKQNNFKIIEESALYSLMTKNNQGIYVLTNKGNLYYHNFWGEIKNVGKMDVNPIYWNSDSTKILMKDFDKLFDTEKESIAVYNSSLFKDIAYLNNQFSVKTYSHKGFIEPLNQFKTVNNLPYKNLSITNGQMNLRLKRASEVEIDTDDNIWIQYTDGLFIHKKDGDVKEVKYNNKPILGSCLQKFNKGICIKNDQKTLYLEVNKVSVLHHLDKQNDNYKIIDSTLFIWNGSHLSINNLKEKTELKFTKYDGLSDCKIIDLFIRDNQLIIVNEKGYQQIKMPFGKLKSTPPILYLDSVLIDGKKQNILNKTFNFFTVNSEIILYLNALSIKSQNDHFIEYKLNNSVWKKLDPKLNTIELSSLRSGNHTLNIRVHDVDGLYSDILVKYIYVPQPWYKSLYFIITASLFLVLLTFFIAKKRIKAIEKKNAEALKKEALKRELIEQKFIAFRAQINPHFIFNALNTAQYLFTSKNKIYASEYVNDFAELLRDYLHESESEFISLDKEIELLKRYLKIESYRFDGEFKYEINTEKVNESLSNIFVPVMLLQPYVENAIKHGVNSIKGEKLIQLNFTQEKDRLIVNIIDNGIGFSANTDVNKKHKSFATDALKKRFLAYKKLKGYDIRVEIYSNENDSKGTRVEVSFPIITAEFI